MGIEWGSRFGRHFMHAGLSAQPISHAGLGASRNFLLSSTAHFMPDWGQAEFFFSALLLFSLKYNLIAVHWSFIY